LTLEGRPEIDEVKRCIQGLGENLHLIAPDLSAASRMTQEGSMVDKSATKVIGGRTVRGAGNHAQNARRPVQGAVPRLADVVLVNSVIGIREVDAVPVA